MGDKTPFRHKADSFLCEKSSSQAIFLTFKNVSKMDFILNKFYGLWHTD